MLLDLVRPEDYVSWEYFSRQKLIAKGVAASREGRPARVLDVGCGFGALSLTLSEAAGFDVAAMDILETRIASVRSKRTARDPAAASRVRLVRANAEALPFRAATFDAVVATEVLEHLNEPERFLRETRRVLRDGGRFFMTTPNARSLPYRILPFLPPVAVEKLAVSLTRKTLHPDLIPHSTEPGESLHPDRHRREGFSLREVQAIAERVGLRMLVGYTYRIPLPDRVMAIAPRRLSRGLARLGTQRLPMALQLYAEFTTS